MCQCKRRTSVARKEAMVTGMNTVTATAMGRGTATVTEPLSFLHFLYFQRNIN